MKQDYRCSDCELTKNIRTISGTLYAVCDECFAAECIAKVNSLTPLEKLWLALKGIAYYEPWMVHLNWTYDGEPLEEKHWYITVWNRQGKMLDFWPENVAAWVDIPRNSNPRECKEKASGSWKAGIKALRRFLRETDGGQK